MKDQDNFHMENNSHKTSTLERIVCNGAVGSMLLSGLAVLTTLNYKLTQGVCYDLGLKDTVTDTLSYGSAGICGLALLGLGVQAIVAYDKYLKEVRYE